MSNFLADPMTWIVLFCVYVFGFVLVLSLQNKRIHDLKKDCEFWYENSRIHRRAYFELLRARDYEETKPEIANRETIH